MKKRIVSAALVLAMSLSFAACGDKETSKKPEVKEADISASEVMSKMADSSDSIEGIDSSISINFGASVTEGEEKNDIAIKGNMDIKGNTDPAESYINADLSVKSGKDSQDIKYEVYLVTEDDQYKVYFGNDEDGWFKTEMSLDELGIDMLDMAGSMDEMKELYSDENIEEYFDNLKVTEKKIDDKKCYSVKGDISKDLLSTALESLSSLAGTSIDIPDIKISFEVCTDKETGSPVEVNIKADVDKNDTIDISACEISFKYNGYEKQDIEIPDEALDAQDISGAGLY